MYSAEYSLLYLFDLIFQVYHYCHFDGRQDSFLCPRGTVFNQAVFVCDWWYNVDCNVAQDFYQLNQNLYRVNTALNTRIGIVNFLPFKHN